LKLSVGKTAGVVKPEVICGRTVVTGVGQTPAQLIAMRGRHPSWRSVELLINYSRRIHS